MQLLGKDVIVLSYVGAVLEPTADGRKAYSGTLLHQTADGFQFGHGKERQIVTSIEEVPEAVFGPIAHRAVKVWLSKGGTAQAEQAVMDRDLAERASEMPGTLDAMADKLGHSMKAQLFKLLSDVLKGVTGGTLHLPDTMTEAVPEDGIDKLPDPALVQDPPKEKIDGGWLLHKGNGHKEFMDEDAMQESEAKRGGPYRVLDKALDADLDEEIKLVRAGVGNASPAPTHGGTGSMSKEMRDTRKTVRK
jgi:hypothetical protein